MRHRLQVWQRFQPKTRARGLRQPETLIRVPTACWQAVRWLKKYGKAAKRE